MQSLPQYSVSLT